MSDLQQWEQDTMPAGNTIVLSWMERRPFGVRRDGFLAASRRVLAGDCANYSE